MPSAARAVARSRQEIVALIIADVSMAAATIAVAAMIVALVLTPG
jgi:hypothetical protein